MTAQEAALVAVAQLFTRLDVPYMIIGGQANAIWGEPRATLDVDVTVCVSEADLAATVARIIECLTPVTADPTAFARETRVLPVTTSAGVRIDVVFGQLPFEEEAIARAVPQQIAGETVRYCAAEDVILHKIHSSRPRDLDDAHGITLRQFARLDRAYLDPRVAELASALDAPEIAERWASWCAEATARRST